MVKMSGWAVEVGGVSRIKECAVKTAVASWHHCAIQSFIHFYIIQLYIEFCIQYSPAFIFLITVLHSVCHTALTEGS